MTRYSQSPMETLGLPVSQLLSIIPRSYNDKIKYHDMLMSMRGCFLDQGRHLLSPSVCISVCLLLETHFFNIKLASLKGLELMPCQIIKGDKEILLPRLSDLSPVFLRVVDFHARINA